MNVAVFANYFSLSSKLLDVQTIYHIISQIRRFADSQIRRFADNYTCFQNITNFLKNRPCRFYCVVRKNNTDFFIYQNND